MHEKLWEETSPCGLVMRTAGTVANVVFNKNTDMLIVATLEVLKTALL